MVDSSICPCWLTVTNPYQLIGYSDKKEEPDPPAEKDEKKGEDEKRDQDEDEQNDKQSQPKSSSAKEDSAVEPHGRKGSTASNILEKGQCYCGSRVTPSTSKSH